MTLDDFERAFRRFASRVKREDMPLALAGILLVLLAPADGLPWEDCLAIIREVCAEDDAEKGERCGA